MDWLSSVSRNPATKNAAFHTIEDYTTYMRHPSRVVRLEWRKTRRPELKGLTSHSWLEAELLSGRRRRI